MTSGAWVFRKDREQHARDNQGDSQHGLRGVMFAENRDAEDESVEPDR